MNCEKYESYIALFADNELSQEETGELMLHVKDCESCRQQLEAVKYMKIMLNQEDNRPAGNMRSRVYGKIYRDLLILFAGLVIILSGVAVSGGLTQMLWLGSAPNGIKVLFIFGILLLIIGLVVLLYDIFIDLFKILARKK